LRTFFLQEKQMGCPPEPVLAKAGTGVTHLVDLLFNNHNRHAREGGHPICFPSKKRKNGIPAYAGMTIPVQSFALKVLFCP